MPTPSDVRQPLQQPRSPLSQPLLRDLLPYLAMIPAVTAGLVYDGSIAWNWQSMRSYRFASRIVKPRDLSLRLSSAAARNRELIRRRREHSFGRLLVPFSR